MLHSQYPENSQDVVGTFLRLLVEFKVMYTKPSIRFEYMLPIPTRT